MAFQFRRDEAVADGVRRIVLEQIDRAVAEIDDRALDRDETVHQVRKCCKKIRAVLRLVRPRIGDEAYRRENAAYREAARELSRARDAAVLLQTCTNMREAIDGAADREALAAITDALCSEQERPADDESALEERIAECRRKLQAARQRVAFWPLGGDGFDTIARGLRETYHRGRRAFRRAYKHVSAEHFHEWRKRVKDDAYHMTLLRGLGGKRLKARRRRLAALGERLGRLHDLDVFGDFIAGEHGGAERATVLLDEQRDELRRTLRPLGKRLFKERPQALASRLRRAWDRWYRGPERQTIRIG